jgi:hypothetical protein
VIIGGFCLALRRKEPDMFSMRSLLAADPMLPPETRRALARKTDDARLHLLELGVNECVAAELLDERPDPRLPCNGG